MSKSARSWSLCLSVLLCLFSSLGAAQAHFSASPFIADDQPDTADYVADFVSSPNHTAFHIATRVHPAPCGTYAGVLITPWRPFQGLHSISFLAKGACTHDLSEFQPAVIVEYGTAGKVIRRVFVPCARAEHIPEHDGFDRLVFTAKEFRLSSSSVIHSIVIADNIATEEGSFLVDDIRVNDMPVHKDFKDRTKFFQVSSCSPTGPLGDLRQALAGAPNSTKLTLTNGTGSPVNVYLTLGGAAPNTPCVAGDCVQDVTQVFPGMQQNGGPLVGVITLSANQSVSYTGSQTIQGNLSFGAVFQNCPRSGFPNGMNYAEFTLNVPVGPNPTFPYQEAVDISCVAGVNADVAMAMTNSSNQPDTTWTNAVAGPVTSMENGPLNSNLNIPGVFPPGCDDCADRTTINPPPCFTSPQCNSTHICNVQRDQSLEGGTVTVTFKKFE